MGLFVEQRPSAALTQLVTELLRADPAAANDAGRVAAATEVATAAATTPVYLGRRIIAGIIIGGVLLAVGLFLIWLGDQQAIDLAREAAGNTDFKPPTLGISAAGTSVVTLGAAWSAALVGALLSGK